MGLVAVLLPDPCNQLPDVMKDDDTTLFRTQWIATDTTASSDLHETYTALFQVEDLKKVSDLDTMDGKDLMKDMETFFNKKKVERSLRKEWKLSDISGENHTSTHFEWQGDDFVLHNHDVKLTRHNSTYYPKFYINAALAMTIGWFIDRGGNSYSLGPNLILEIPDGAIPDLIDLPNPGSAKFWNHDAVTDFYGVSTNMFQLSMTCNWRFTNLNKVLGMVAKPNKRSLFIYSD